LTKASRLLCHYTSIEGLAGIVKNKQIWATHPYYLNDASELKAGLSYLFEECFSKLHSKVQSLVEHAYLQMLKAEKGGLSNQYCLPVEAEKVIHKRVQVVLKELKNNVSDFVFVASFCGEQGIDSNYHWLTYSHNLTGYCIIFEEDYIKNLAFPNTTMNLEEVEYCNSYDDLLNEVADLISSVIFTEFSRAKIAREFDYGEIDGECLKKNLLDMTTRVNRSLAMYKPCEYSEELESRLVAMKFLSPESDDGLPNIEFRTSSSGTFIPYQPIPIDPTKIKKVIIRSDSHIELKIKSCELFLRKELGGNCPEVVASKATLRTSL
tara:strand:+ start:4906 stop:5871 length:966 start_codon:yes stop_codon:yes gene_type:complete